MATVRSPLDPTSRGSSPGNRADDQADDSDQGAPPWPRPQPAWSLADRVSERLGFTVGPRQIAAALLAVVVVAGAGWWFLRPSAPSLDATIPLAGAPASASTGSGSAGATSSGSPAGVASAGDTGSSSVPGAVTSTTAGDVVVQAAGAVAHPGVYRLPASARVDDLVRAAGGLSADADGDRVNLAAPVADGARIWFPHHGEDQPPDVVAGGSPSGGGVGATTPGTGGSGSGSGSGGAGAPPAIVDLNTATAEQLDTLPGVGPATAQAILSYRTEHGRFSAVDDLLDVRGIGDAKLEQLRPYVSV
jgi:competence protein ComEA